MAPSDDRARRIGLSGLFSLALAVGLFIARPFSSAAIAFDSQVATLEFARIASGMRLESLVLTTSKPLLTVVFGSLHELTGDWRPIAWATILAFAIGCVLVAELARRLAGPLAGAFAGVAAIAAPALIGDVGLALATPWALLGWAGAGLALTGSRPRYGLAGVALLVATLARLETIVVIGIAGAALICAELLVRRATSPIASVPRTAWLVPLLGLLAIPIMCLHDLVLSGDPFFWATVATRYSSATTLTVLSPSETVQWLAGRYAANAILLVLALVGFMRLVLDRRGALAIGVIALGPGIAASLVLLALRGVFVSDRYAAAIDLSIAFAAGIGIAGWASETWPRLQERWPAARRLTSSRTAPVAAAGMLAILLAWPHGVLDADLRATARQASSAARAADRALTAVKTAIGSNAGASSLIMAVPTSLRPRLAVDMDLPLGALMGTDGARPGATPAFPRPGLLILHIPSAERQPGALAGLEEQPPVLPGPFGLDPVAADPAVGWWLVRVR